MKKPIVLIIFLSVIVVMLAVVRITAVNNISTTGKELVDLQNQIADYKKQNELLKERYLEAASFTNISAKAKKVGFGPIKSKIDLSTPLPLALKQ